MSGLTERQQQCLEGVLQYKTAKHIGRELGITHHAVEKHLKAARVKLGADDTLQAARTYIAQLTTGRPYYGAAELSQPGEEGPTIDRPEPMSFLLRDVATDSKGLVYDFCPRQTLIAIALAGIGLVAVLALIIAIAQGVGQLTS